MRPFVGACATRIAGWLGTAMGAIVAGALGLAPTPAAAQATGAKPEMMENCPGLVAGAPPALQRVAFERTALNPDQVRLTYVGHSTFLIESPRLVRIATDYNSYVRPAMLPDIATMNHAHSTHYTDAPEPGIKHVLRGWAGDEKPARYDLTYQDVRVRNVPTNIRTWGGGGTERHGNSIFVFETANLCIAHLGHLHHTLTQAQLNEIGRIDVVMVPVDGTYTLDLDGMVEVVQGLKAQIVIPMHYFSAYTLNRFLERVRTSFEVEVRDVPSLVVSKATMPAKPTVMVLPGH